MSQHTNSGQASNDSPAPHPSTYSRVSWSRPRTLCYELDQTRASGAAQGGKNHDIASGIGTGRYVTAITRCPGIASAPSVSRTTRCLAKIVRHGKNQSGRGYCKNKRKQCAWPGLTMARVIVPRGGVRQHFLQTDLARVHACLASSARTLLVRHPALSARCGSALR